MFLLCDLLQPMEHERNNHMQVPAGEPAHEEALQALMCLGSSKPSLEDHLEVVSGPEWDS